MLFLDLYRVRLFSHHDCVLCGILQEHVDITDVIDAITMLKPDGNVHDVGGVEPSGRLLIHDLLLHIEADRQGGHRKEGSQFRW